MRDAAVADADLDGHRAGLPAHALQGLDHGARRFPQRVLLRGHVAHGPIGNGLQAATRTPLLDVRHDATTRGGGGPFSPGRSRS